MRVVRILLVLLLVGYLLTGITQIRPGERAVVRRFGRVLEHKPEPGLWVGLPWGMERVERVSVDLLRPVDLGYRPTEDDDETTPRGQLIAGDQNLVNARIVVNYRIRPEQVEEYVAQLDATGEAASIDRSVAAAAESLVAEWVAGRNVDDVLLRGKAELPRWLVDRPERRLEKRLAPLQLGIEITGATITHLAPPQQVQDAFDRVTQAQANIRTLTDAAQGQAQRTIRQKESEKFSIVQLAHAYAQEQRLQAQADAASFEKRMRQYHEARAHNPDVLTAIWWEQMGELFKRLRANGKLDLLDHHLGADGLNLMQVAPLPVKQDSANQSRDR
jgi:membrane protease subunit HflK